MKRVYSIGLNEQSNVSCYTIQKHDFNKLFFLLLFLDWNIKFVTFPVFQNRFQFRQQVEIDQDEFVSEFVNALSIVMR